MRVDDLISERTEREIRSLRNVGKVGSFGLLDDSTVHRPETTQDSEEGTLSTAIGSNDQEMLARSDCEAPDREKRFEGMRTV